MSEVLGTEFNEELDGTGGEDIITGLSGYDTLDGGESSDTYIVHASDFQNRYVDFYIDSGTTGIDTILAAQASIIIGIGNGFSYASSGIEVIDGLGGSTISGDNDRQVWDFTGVEITGVDVLFGMGGHDEIRGTNAADTIDGGLGHDSLSGGLGNDTLLGADGHDQLFGDTGSDTLEGGTGHDILVGGEGRDYLNGNAGYDILDGGQGSDIYWVGLDNTGFVDTYNDSGDGDRDVIRAIEDGTVIGLISGFGPDSGIEVITAYRNGNVTIGGTNDAEIWDFSNTRLVNIASIDAGDGQDIITGNTQRNTINGDSGHDLVYGGKGADTLSGGGDSDFLFGEMGRDTLNGDDGHDILDGGRGRDTLFGGTGHDILIGGRGRDSLTGGEGYDIFEFGPNSGHDVITDFSLTDDRIDLSAFDGSVTYDSLEFIQGDEGLTIFVGRNSILLENIFLDSLSSDAFLLPEASDVDSSVIEDAADPALTLVGDWRDNTLEGGSDNDYLFGDSGNDTLIGGDGDDELFGSHNEDILFGGDGDDLLDGGNDADELDGGDGDDTLIGFNGTDLLIGGAGDDTLDGGNDDDILFGGDGDDMLEGYNGRDTLDGGAGDDTLSGYNDADILTGGTGDDMLTGGYGSDIFVFAEGDGLDVITDFENYNDMIDLSSFGLSGFADLTLYMSENNTVILELSDEQTIEFANVSDLSILTEDDFIF